MSNYAQLYWLTRLDNIQGFLTGMITLSILGIVIYSVSNMLGSIELEYGEFSKRYKWILKTFITSLVLSTLTWVFMPTKNDLIFIYAGGKAMDYVEADTSLQKIPFQTTKIISDYLDKKLKETETNKQAQ